MLRPWMFLQHVLCKISKAGIAPTAYRTIAFPHYLLLFLLRLERFLRELRFLRERLREDLRLLLGRLVSLTRYRLKVLVESPANGYSSSGTRSRLPLLHRLTLHGILRLPMETVTLEPGDKPLASCL